MRSNGPFAEKDGEAIPKRVDSSAFIVGHSSTRSPPTDPLQLPRGFLNLGLDVG